MRSRRRRRWRRSTRAFKKNGAPFSGEELLALWLALEAALADTARIAELDRTVWRSVVAFGRDVCARHLNRLARRGSSGRSGYRTRWVKGVLGDFRLKRPYFAPDLKAIRASEERRRGRPGERFDRIRPGTGCQRRANAAGAFPFDAKLGLVNGMTRSLSWIVQRAATVCGSFAEGVEVLSEFSGIGFSKSAFRGKALKAGRRAEAAQDSSSERLISSWRPSETRRR